MTAFGGVILVCSTTGNGDPPDSADRFYRKLRRRRDPVNLEGVNFAVLALGDTNYDKFCHCGKIINSKMLEHGASAFHELGCADEAMGLETVVDPWRDGLLAALVTLKSQYGGRSGE